MDAYQPLMGGGMGGLGPTNGEHQASGTGRRQGGRGKEINTRLTGKTSNKKRRETIC